MNAYEVTIIFQPELEEEARKATLANLENLVLKEKGRAGDSKQMGSRKLAYQVKKVREGFFVHTSFQIEPSEVHRIGELLDSDNGVVRVMLTRKRSTRLKREKNGRSKQSAGNRAPDQRT